MNFYEAASACQRKGKFSTLMPIGKLRYFRGELNNMFPFLEKGQGPYRVNAIKMSDLGYWLEYGTNMREPRGEKRYKAIAKKTFQTYFPSFNISTNSEAYKSYVNYKYR